jgi:hypothetical protein
MYRTAAQRWILQKPVYRWLTMLFCVSCMGWMYLSRPPPFTHFPDEDGNLDKIYELKLNAEFVDVNAIPIPTFELPANFSPQRSLEIDELREIFRLENFRFEGLVVINVTDVTQEQITSEIKNALLNINAFTDVEVYDELEKHVQSLIRLRNVKIGITPFFKKNDYYLYTETHYRNSLLFKDSSVIVTKTKSASCARRSSATTACRCCTKPWAVTIPGTMNC